MTTPTGARRSSRSSRGSRTRRGCRRSSPPASSCQGRRRCTPIRMPRCAPPCAALGADWTGDAATNAGRHAPARRRLEPDAGASRRGRADRRGLRRSFESLRGQVHWDDPWAWGWNDTASAAASVATLNPAPFLGNLTVDYFATAQQNRTNDAAAVAALRAHEQQTRTGVDAFPTIDPATGRPRSSGSVPPGPNRSRHHGGPGVDDPADTACVHRRRCRGARAGAPQSGSAAGGAGVQASGRSAAVGPQPQDPGVGEAYRVGWDRRGRTASRESPARVGIPFPGTARRRAARRAGRRARRNGAGRWPRAAEPGGPVGGRRGGTRRRGHAGGRTALSAGAGRAEPGGGSAAAWVAQVAGGRDRRRLRLCGARACMAASKLASRRRGRREALRPPGGEGAAAIRRRFRGRGRAAGGWRESS